MPSFRRILVDIDALAPLHPAMAQAIDLARRAEAGIKIVDVVEEVPRRARAYLSAAIEAEALAERADRLEDAVARYRKTGLSIDTAILRGSPVVALVREVLRHGHDLLVRYHGRDLKAAKGFDTIDMQLLRKCPCPVWLVGVGEKSRPRRIMAAVHPDHEHEVEQALNRRILRAAADLALLENGTLTVVTAWDTFGETLMAGRVSKADLKAYVRTARDGAAEELDALLRLVPIDGVKADVELVKGQPDEALPRFARRQDIDVVVMGTVARGGLRGLIMGNTAERVLRRLRCSVMALKPEGFESPIRLTEE